jgi:hypothetical protein
MLPDEVIVDIRYTFGEKESIAKVPQEAGAYNVAFLCCVLMPKEKPFLIGKITACMKT